MTTNLRREWRSVVAEDLLRLIVCLRGRYAHLEAADDPGPRRRTLTPCKDSLADIQ